MLHTLLFICHSSPHIFDRASSLSVVQQALIAPEQGLAPGQGQRQGQGQDNSEVLERMVIDRPIEYYNALTSHLVLTQTAQSNAQSKSQSNPQSKSQSNQSPRQERDNGRSWTLLELLQRKQLSQGTVRLIVCPQHLPKVIFNSRPYRYI